MAAKIRRTGGKRCHDYITDTEQHKTTMNTALQKSNGNKPQTLKGWLQSDQFKATLQSVMARHLSPERFVRLAILATQRVPKLTQCTQESVFQCLQDLSAMGLEPDGRRAHLIPFDDRKSGKTICTLIVDYKGIVDMVRRSGEVSYIHADVVHENDEFDYMFGTESYLRHKPKLGKRGKPIAAYSYVKLKDGTHDFDLMDLEAVEATRKRSKAANNGPWQTDWNEMAKKTVFRRHSKWLPLSNELREKIEKDDDAALSEQERFQAAKPVFADPTPELMAETPQQEESEERTPQESEESDVHVEATLDDKPAEQGSEQQQEFPTAASQRGISEARQKLLSDMATFLQNNGVAEEALIQWGHETGNIDEEIESIDDVKTSALKKLWNMRQAILPHLLEAAKQGGVE